MFHCQHLKFSHYQQLADESKYFSIQLIIYNNNFSVEIWCGCSLGNIRILDVRTAQLSVQLSHQILSGSGSVHLLCASRDSPYQYSVWTAMKTGTGF